MRQSWIILLVLFLFGIVWPHSDYAVIIVAFALFIILPIIASLAFGFLIILIFGYSKGNKSFLRTGRIGLLTLAIIISAPFISVVTVDSYYKLRGRSIIENLERYKTSLGHYPVDLREISETLVLFNMTYKYNSDKNSYILKYSSRGMVTTTYNSSTNEWQSHGWD